jgi:nitroreductase
VGVPRAPERRGVGQPAARLVDLRGGENLLLAARPRGIGGVLTSFYLGHEDEVRELLGLPADAATMALVPLGYPVRGRWAQPRRRPVEDVVHWERWGTLRDRG